MGPFRTGAGARGPGWWVCLLMGLGWVGLVGVTVRGAVRGVSKMGCGVWCFVRGRDRFGLIVGWWVDGRSNWGVLVRVVVMVSRPSSVFWLAGTCLSQDPSCFANLYFGRAAIEG